MNVPTRDGVVVVVVQFACVCCFSRHNISRSYYYARPHRAEALSDDARLTSVCRDVARIRVLQSLDEANAYNNLTESCTTAKFIVRA